MLFSVLRLTPKPPLRYHTFLAVLETVETREMSAAAKFWRFLQFEFSTAFLSLGDHVSVLGTCKDATIFVSAVVFDGATRNKQNLIKRKVDSFDGRDHATAAQLWLLDQLATIVWDRYSMNKAENTEGEGKNEFTFSVTHQDDGRLIFRAQNATGERVSFAVDTCESRVQGEILHKPAFPRPKVFRPILCASPACLNSELLCCEHCYTFCNTCYTDLCIECSPEPVICDGCGSSEGMSCPKCKDECVVACNQCDRQFHTECADEHAQFCWLCQAHVCDVCNPNGFAAMPTLGDDEEVPHDWKRICNIHLVQQP